MADQRQERDNSGAMFVNDRKQKDTHPDYNGSCMIEGVEYWLKGWRKTAKDTGLEFVSFAFERKDAQKPAGGQQRPQQQGNANRSRYPS